VRFRESEKKQNQEPRFRSQEKLIAHNSKTKTMIKNNFKIALRYLMKNKLYSMLNILGLALGIAAFVIIMLYVGYERSYDRFEGSSSVYRIYMDYKEGDTFRPGDAQTYNLTGPTFKKEFPEIEEQVRLFRLEKVTFVYGDKIIEQANGSLADATYFDIFNSPLLSENLTDFDKPNTILLTQTLAGKIFGKESAMGKRMSVFNGSETTVEVVGIINDIADNTHFKTNYFISFPTMNTWTAMFGNEEPNWTTNNFFTYIKIAPTTDVIALREKIKNSNFENDPDERHNIEALTDIHLYSDKPYEAEANGSVSRVRFLSAIAFIILLLSWLNYVNLATAKSLERSKEVGIRKVAGAQRFQLILQSLGESLLLNTFAILLGLSLVYLLLPLFKGFVGKELSLGFSNLSTFIPFLLFILAGTLLSGIYPAIVISGFSPLRALKGNVLVKKGSIGIRKILITVQFLATAILIIGTLVVGKQINYLREQPIGVDLANVVALKGEILGSESDSITALKADVLQGELLKLPFIKSVSRARTFPGDGYDNLSSTVGITYPDGIDRPQQLFYIYGAQPEYFELLNLKIVAGKPFFKKASEGKDIILDENDIVMNETFAKSMGYQNMEEIIGKNIKFWGQSFTVAGVVEDYHHFGLKDNIEPLIVGPYSGMKNILVKFNNESSSIAGMEKNLDVLRSKWKKVFPNSTLKYTFLDKKFEAQYREDTQFGQAFQLFTGLAIFIAALGLFGLTSYTILQRKKEIGIRKVSGASVLQILALLNKDFLKLVGIAFVIAVPISWYVMSRWLQEFAYQTTLSWWIFAVAGFAAFTIALISVSFQAIKAAVANPVNSLRSE
jgi:putative ABC transport system permease protein